MAKLWAHHRLIFTFGLCILIALLAFVVILPLWRPAPPVTTIGQASATTAAPTATWHATYSIVLEGPFTTTVRRGGQLTYRWFPQFDASPKSPARGTITCTFALYGPFATQADADHAGQTNLSAIKPAVAAAPVTLDRWTSEPRPGVLIVPENLALGYYVSIGRTIVSDGSALGAVSTNITIICIVG